MDKQQLRAVVWGAVGEVVQGGLSHRGATKLTDRITEKLAEKLELGGD